MQKLDNGQRRKLSKRKDPEATVNYYIEQGYPTEAIMEHLLTLANSNFEDWKSDNPYKKYKEFLLDISKLNNSGLY